jgi:hypothetical protein
VQGGKGNATSARMVYTKKPIFKRVTKQEFEEFLNLYPRALEKHGSAICEPPNISYNDFELANRWPYSIVANTFLYSDDENSYYYEPPEEKKYYILINYKKVFDSKTGNKA